MPRDKRYQGFLMYPNAILTDPDFLKLTHAGQRAYCLLVLAAWGQKEPGVLPAIPGYLARQAMVDVSEWTHIESELLVMFKIRGDGAWTLPVMIEGHRAQNRRHLGYKEAGSLGGKSRHSNELSSHATPNGQASLKHAEEEVEVEAEAEEEKTTPLPPTKKSRSRPKPEPIDEEYLTSLEAEFPEQEIREARDAYLNHRVSKKHVDQRLGLRNWIKKDIAWGGGSGGLSPAKWRPKFWYGSEEDRPTPGWVAPGPLSWSAGGRLGIELPNGERWRQLTKLELDAWQRSITGGRS